MVTSTPPIVFTFAGTRLRTRRSNILDAYSLCGVRTVAHNCPHPSETSMLHVKNVVVYVYPLPAPHESTSHRLSI